MGHYELIKTTLLNMRNDSMKLSSKPSNDEYRNLMKKYNTVFTGEKLNKVLSLEISHHLKMSNIEFNSHIGKVTHDLGMGLEGLHQLDSEDPDSTDAYYITLF